MFLLIDNGDLFAFYLIFFFFSSMF